jgi:hypothetical protein
MSNSKSKMPEVDRLVSKHLKNTKGENFEELKGCQVLTHCSYASEAQRTFVAFQLVLPPPEFAKEMEKIWGLWCEGLCSVMDELKQIHRISKFKFFDCCIFASGIQRTFCKALVDVLIRF